MGRILVRGEDGHDIIDELYPVAGEPVIDKPGKGAFYATDLDPMLRNRGIETLLVVRRHHRGVRAHHRARGQRPRLSTASCSATACGSYFPEFHEVGLRMIKAQGGIFGWVADSGAVVGALKG